MKRYITLALLLTSLFSFPMNQVRYHTWFLLIHCKKPANFQSNARIDLLRALMARLEKKEQPSISLTNEDLLHQNTLVTGLTSLKTPDISIFCTTVPSASMAHIDIYSEEDILNRREIGEFCRKYFEAKAHNLAYTLPSSQFPEL